MLGEEKQTKYSCQNSDQKTTQTSQSPMLSDVTSRCEPVEKSVIEEAFFNLKETINQDFLCDLSLKVLLKVFKGLIGKQLFEKSLSQKSLTLHQVNVDLAYPSQVGLKFDVLLVEKKKDFIRELKPHPPDDRVLIIRKTKWNWLKRESKKNTGCIPDYLVFIQIFNNGQESVFRNFESRNLEENLSVIEKWVLNYSDHYFAEILGWLRGADVETLYDSSKIQPRGTIFRKPTFWCYTNDPRLKPMRDFCVREFEN